MNENEQKVLYALCNGDITFSEASEKLGVSKEKIEEMLENYSWVPPSERLAELVEIEMKTILHIREISRPIEFKISKTHEVLRYKQAEFIGSTTVQIPNMPIQRNIPIQTVSEVVLHHTEYNGIPYIQ